MKPFPFVLGTDIVHATRWEISTNPERIIRLAGRLLHETEFQAVKVRNQALYQILRPEGYDLNRINQSLIPGGHNGANREDSILDSKWYRSQLTPSICQNVQKFLGGRWAAKEAAKKAWSAHLIGFKDLRVERIGLDSSSTEEGDPITQSVSEGVKIVCQPCDDSTLQGLHEENIQLAQEGQLSISHDGDYVVATVIAEPLDPVLKELFRKRFEDARKLVTHK